jgi:2-aminoadipate transaminase
MEWRWEFSRVARKVKSSAIRDLLKLTQQPDVISFAGGLPAPELFPVEEIREASNYVLKQEGQFALQYSTTEGYRLLRRFLAKRMTQKGMVVDEDEVLITGGSQQGLDLLGRLFLEEGNWIVSAQPTYVGAIQAFNAYEVKFHTVPLDRDGVKVELIEEAVKEKKPKFIYIVPTFQNPGGVTLSLERRKMLVEIARNYQVPILEDDPYSELRYQGEDLPSLKALGGDTVILLGTFSKIVSPGLRLAWVAGQQEVIEKLVRLKQGADLHTNTFTQYVLYQFLKGGGLDKHIKVLRKEYGQRRRVMLEALDDNFPSSVKWTSPQGGLFLWVELPSGIDATALLPEIVKEKVAYVPGSAFFPNGGGENTLRLNFSNATPKLIREGVKRLAKVFSAKTS